ncbi:MAG: DUF1850 domain-containing protein [Treponema sp.]|nr:DUF1850 domain-containing protein [Treponema sp.]
MKRTVRAVALAAVAGLAAVFAALPGTQVLEIRNERGRIVARLECEDGQFVHRYVHSVHLSDVDEDYTIEKDGSLRLTATRFDTLGVGIPYDAEGGFSQEGNRFVLRMDRTYRSLPVRVSPLPGHAILTGDREYPLSRWFAPGDLAILEVRRIPRIGIRSFRRADRY